LVYFGQQNHAPIAIKKQQEALIEKRLSEGRTKVKSYINNIKIERILDVFEIAVIITNTRGDLLYGNKHYDNIQNQISLNQVILKNVISEAAETGKKVKHNEQHYVITSTPLLCEEHNQTLILSQINDVANMQKLKSELEDSVKRNADYGEKLSRINLSDAIANSANMVKVFEKAKQVAQYPTTVMLVGETGVGKEVIASFIHRNSDRSQKPLIKINCSAIPDQLLESELFGYESGAFTGAKIKGKAGLFELANHGTILLDEIGDMDFALQSKLLRVLQENEIMRLGGQKIIPLDVRVISSTNRNLKTMMEQGSFSDALYYRLNVVELRIPALRQRREDIMPLSTFFLQDFCEKYKLEKYFSQNIRECFLNYYWPGNVRELKNMVENLVVSSPNRQIDANDLPARMVYSEIVNTKKGLESGESMQEAIENLQREYISVALEEKGSIRKAAVDLDIDPSTLHRLIKKLNIKT